MANNQNEKDKIQDIKREYLYSRNSHAREQLGRYLLTSNEKDVLLELQRHQGCHSYLRPTMPIKFKPEGMCDDAFYKALDSLIQVGVVSMLEGKFYWLRVYQIYLYLKRILAYEDEIKRYDEGKKIRSEHGVQGIPSGMMICILGDIHRNAQTPGGWEKNLEYFWKYLA